MRAVFGLICLAGCSFHHELAGDGGAGGSGGSDATPDMPGAEAGGGVDGGPQPDALDPSSCLAKWMSHTVQLTAPVQVPAFTFVGYERDPFLTADDLTLYVSTDVYSISKNVYSATRATATAAFPDTGQKSESAFNSVYADEKVALTADTAIVATGRGGSGIDLYEAPRSASGAIGALATTNFALVNGTATDEHDPWLSADGTRLYFAPYDTGTDTQKIRLATRAAVGTPFGAPVDVPLQEAGNTGDPFLANGEKLILYSAGGNLRYATRASTADAFGAATALDQANSPSVDGDPILTSDACTLIFSSDRDGADFDIWTADVMH